MLKKYWTASQVLFILQLLKTWYETSIGSHIPFVGEASRFALACLKAIGKKQKHCKALYADIKLTKTDESQEVSHETIVFQ